MHGLFNLRGGAAVSGSVQLHRRDPGKVTTASDRAVIVERGDFRFATLGQRIDTIEAAAETLQPVADAALLPALDSKPRPSAAISKSSTGPARKPASNKLSNSPKAPEAAPSALQHRQPPQLSELETAVSPQPELLCSRN